MSDWEIDALTDAIIEDTWTAACGCRVLLGCDPVCEQCNKCIECCTCGLEMVAEKLGIDLESLEMKLANRSPGWLAGFKFGLRIQGVSVETERA